MGLALRAYANIQPVAGLFKFEGCTEVHDATTGNLRDDLVGFYVHPVYPAWAEGIEPFVPYSYSYKESLHMGSYTWYGHFRNWLSELAENGDVDAPGDPFFELIVFSDCKGTINTTVSAKLYADFVRFHHKAKTDQQSMYYLRAYEDAMRAFQIASANGAVHFG